MPKTETFQVLMQAARQRLANAGIATAALDARLLLQEAAGVSHDELIAAANLPADDCVAQKFEALLRRRANHEPVSRILGRREFYGRRFNVTPDVLDPRADTETVIELCLAQADRALAMRILDLGAGSGAIIVTLLAELPNASGVAIDVSAKALSVAEHNARWIGVHDRLTAIAGSWFDQVTGRFDLIVSNPPYIPAQAIAGLAVDVREYDPPLALDGGVDGLGAYRVIAASAPFHLNQNGVLVVEIGAGQMDEVVAIFAKAHLRLVASQKDLGGHVRALGFSGA